jgi:hypothetical protein
MTSAMGETKRRKNNHQDEMSIITITDNSDSTQKNAT